MQAFAQRLFDRVATAWTLSAVMVWAAPGLSQAAFSIQSADPEPGVNDIPIPHKEVPEGTYVPRPRRPPVIGPRQRTIYSRGSFVSVQVNVNEIGLNLTGDAANEPSIAVDPTDHNRMAIGWRQFDTITDSFRQAGWAYTQDGGQNWTFVDPDTHVPNIIEAGLFRSDPVLDSDSAGNFYYYSLRVPNNSFLCDVFKSTDGGATWGPRVAAFGGDKAWMAIDRTEGSGNGHIYCSWSRLAGCCGNDVFTRSTNGGSNWMTPLAFSVAPIFGTLCVGPDGELYVAGVDFPNNGNFIVAKSTNAKDASVTPTFPQIAFVDLGGEQARSGGPNPGGLLGQVWVAADHSNGASRGNVYMLCSVDPPGADPLDIMFSRSTDGGWNWSPPVRVNDDALDNGAWQWFGTMSVAPNGRIDVIWNDTRNSGTLHSELYYSSSVDGGATWSANIPVSPMFNPSIGWPSQNKLGDYYDMVSDDVGADIAYAATFNGEQDVYYLRLFLDCNQNGILDSEDIAQGTSPDCSGNGTPDECEPDCNANTFPDSCDIVSGTSVDCGSNEIPDECEPDCNGNGVADSCDIFIGTSTDCDADSTPDDCQPFLDCNGNAVFDACDISMGSSEDCGGEGVPDECEFDCDNDGVPDSCDPPGFTNFVFDHDGEDMGPFVPAADGPVAQDIHFGGPASVGRLQLRYLSVGTASPTIITLRLFENNANDTLLPTLPSGLIAEFLREELVSPTPTAQTTLFNVGRPFVVPPDVWMEVEFSPAPGYGGFGPGRFYVMKTGEGPSEGASDGLVHNRANQTTQSGVHLSYAVRGTLCEDCNGNGRLDACDVECGGEGGVCNTVGCGQSPDCNRNRIPDECEPDADGDQVPDDCDSCPNEAALIEPNEPGEESTCDDSIDNDCDGQTDSEDSDCPAIVCPCGDLDGDGGVGLNDFATFVRCFGLGAPTAGCPVEQLTCSNLDAQGGVDLNDFFTFVRLFDGAAAGEPPNCGTPPE